MRQIHLLQNEIVIGAELFWFFYVRIFIHSQLQRRDGVRHNCVVGEGGSGERI